MVSINLTPHQTEMVDIMKYQEEKNDIVLEAAQTAINEFANTRKSINIENVASEYALLVVDKIFEKSKDLVIHDGGSGIMDKYSDKLKKYLDHIDSITVYSDRDESHFRNKKIAFVKIGEGVVSEFLNNDIKSAIIGDSVRFMVEKPSTVPSYKKFKDALQNFFKHKTQISNNSVVERNKSITNFSNAKKAEQFIVLFSK